MSQSSKRSRGEFPLCFIFFRPFSTVPTLASSNHSLGDIHALSILGASRMWMMTTGFSGVSAKATKLRDRFLGRFQLRASVGVVMSLSRWFCTGAEGTIGKWALIIPLTTGMLVPETLWSRILRISSLALLKARFSTPHVLPSEFQLRYKMAVRFTCFIDETLTRLLWRKETDIVCFGERWRTRANVATSKTKRV